MPRLMHARGARFTVEMTPSSGIRRPIADAITMSSGRTTVATKPAI